MDADLKPAPQGLAGDLLELLSGHGREAGVLRVVAVRRQQRRPSRAERSVHAHFQGAKGETVVAIADDPFLHEVVRKFPVRATQHRVDPHGQGAFFDHLLVQVDVFRIYPRVLDRGNPVSQQAQARLLDPSLHRRRRRLWNLGLHQRHGVVEQ